MANLIQLEAYNSEVAENWYEIWINSDQIISVLSDPKGARIFFANSVQIHSNTIAKTSVYVRESPQQVRDKVVAERKAKPGKGWLR